MMTPRHALLVLLFLSPCLAERPRGDAHATLKDYLDALGGNDLSRLESLLGPHFEFRYQEADAVKIIDRDAEIRSLKKLFSEAIVEVKEVRRNTQRANQYHVTFNVRFGESSADLRSFFFSSGLVIDETFVISLEGGQIARLVAQTNSKVTNRLSFGLLKSIYATETTSEALDRGPDTIFKLFDAHTHKLLLWKKVVQGKDGFEHFYYLPNNRRIQNILW